VDRRGISADLLRSLELVPGWGERANGSQTLMVESHDPVTRTSARVSCETGSRGEGRTVLGTPD
jgi:hypothetical protein